MEPALLGDEPHTFIEFDDRTIELLHFHIDSLHLFATGIIIRKTAIVNYILPDLNAYDVDAAMKIIAGTAKNMGIEVIEK